MNKWLLLFLIFTCYAMGARSQSFYVGSSPGKLFKVTKTPAGFTYEQVNTCTGVFNSVAMTSTYFYWTTNTSIFRGKLNDLTLDNCEQIGVMPVSSVALTVGPSGHLYYVTNNVLYTATTTPGAVTTVRGRVPYNPSGDMIFYKGKLYMMAREGVVLIDSTDPENKTTLLIPAGNQLQSALGMFSIAGPQGKIVVYASVVNGGATDIVELDLDNARIVGTAGSLPFGVSDAASDVEDGRFILGPPEPPIITRACGTQLATVQIRSSDPSAVLSYTLNGITNTTGIFTDVQPGSYSATITAATQTQTSPVEIPVLTFPPPKYSYVVVNGSCNSAAGIQFTSAETDCSIQFKSEIFPINHLFNDLTDLTAYHFDILNSSGCKVDELDVTTSTTIPCLPTNFPNTFTPNNDGLNDIFRPLPATDSRNYTMWIYNRLGARVHIAIGHEGWDGTVKGEPVPAGVYYWVAKALDAERKEVTLRGWVAVVR